MSESRTNKTNRTDITNRMDITSLTKPVFTNVAVVEYTSPMLGDNQMNTVNLNYGLSGLRVNWTT